jgi:hypothetical protein
MSKPPCAYPATKNAVEGRVQRDKAAQERSIAFVLNHPDIRKYLRESYMIRREEQPNGRVDLIFEKQ